MDEFPEFFIPIGLARPTHISSEVPRRVTKGDLKRQSGTVLRHVLNGGKVAIRHGGFHRVTLRSTWVRTEGAAVDWSEFVEHPHDFCQSILEGRGYVRIRLDSGWIYLVSTEIEAPSGYSLEQIENWLFKGQPKNGVIREEIWLDPLKTEVIQIAPGIIGIRF